MLYKPHEYWVFYVFYKVVVPSFSSSSPPLSLLLLSIY
nr:MAG TPA: hypothetical protein [Caudoviricetes sp.]